MNEKYPSVNPTSRGTVGAVLHQAVLSLVMAHIVLVVGEGGANRPLYTLEPLHCTVATVFLPFGHLIFFGDGPVRSSPVMHRDLHLFPITPACRNQPFSLLRQFGLKRFGSRWTPCPSKMLSS